MTIEQGIRRSLRKSYAQLSDIPAFGGNQTQMILWIKTAQRVIYRAHLTIQRVLSKPDVIRGDILILKQLKIVCQRFIILEDLLYNNIRVFEQKHFKKLVSDSKGNLLLLLAISDRKDGLCEKEAEEYIQGIINSEKPSRHANSGWYKACVDNMESWLDSKYTPSQTIRGSEQSHIRSISDPNSRRFRN